MEKNPAQSPEDSASRPKMPFKRKAKLFFLLALMILFGIVVFQNSGAVQLKLVFWDVKLSLIYVLLIVMFVGFLVGFIGAKIRLMDLFMMWAFRKK